MTNDSIADDALANERLRAEIAKLRMEAERLGRSGWREPALTLSICGLVVSLLGNVVQWRASDSAAKNAEAQLRLTQEKWGEEREKLRAEVAALQQKAKLSSEDRASIEEQLASTAAQQQSLDAQIDEARQRLLWLTAELAIARGAGNRPHAVKAGEENIALQKAEVERLQGLIAASNVRRSELENRLSR
jgi:chromosome segregation ATPase